MVVPVLGNHKDAKFNETFSDYRGRQGKLTTAPYIDPDLREQDENGQQRQQTHDQTELNELEVQRPKRQTTQRQFLLPGTYSKEKEIEIRQQQYA
jgi:hypothetical protein